jgi:hypothetical protein
LVDILRKEVGQGLSLPGSRASAMIILLRKIPTRIRSSGVGKNLSPRLVKLVEQEHHWPTQVVLPCPAQESVVSVDRIVPEIPLSL